MKEFKCAKCTKYKKIESLAYTYTSKQGKRRVCTACEEAIREAVKRLKG